MDDDEDIPIANGSTKCKGKFSKKRLKTSANLYETCHPLSSIVSIDDNDMEFGDVIPLPSFGLKIIDDKNEIVNYKIHCFSLDFKASWISALRTSVTNNIGVDEDSVYASVLCNDLTIIEQKMAMFKRNGEEKDLIDKVNGYSPLHLAILTSKHLIANQLLRAGANPNTVAKDGSSPLSTGK
jgi:ankyrin repeat protein